jgi:hypothetical protein
LAVNMKKLLTLMCLVAALQATCHANPDIVWNLPASTISTPGVNATNPRIVVDSSGNTKAIWLENAVVKASSQPFGGSWGAIQSLSGSGASSPKLQIDGSGNVTALWVENGVIEYSTLPFGGSWSAEAAISNTGASEPRLFVDNAGNAVAIWARNGYIESATKPFGGSWSLVNQLSTNGAEDNPDVYIGANGTIVAVWHSIVSGANLVYSAKGSVTGSWGAPLDMLAATPAASHNYPRVVVDGNGNATAAWFRYIQVGSVYSQVVVLSASLSATGTAWTAIPSQLSSPGISNPANLMLGLEVDENGYVMAQWTTSFDGSTLNLQTAVLPFSQTWENPLNLDAVDPYSYQGSVSVASIGNAAAAYMYFDGTNVNIQTSESSLEALPMDFGWSAAQTVSQGSDNAYPSISTTYLNGSIQAACIWESYNGVNTVIQATTGSKLTVAPPTNLSVVQNSNNFGVFTEYYNTLSWTASTDPTILEYLIYRNGEFVSAVNYTATQYIDHNAVQNSAVTYGIAAVNGEFSLSNVATVSLP